MMKQLAFMSQMCGGGKTEEPGILVWAAGPQLASSAWLAGVVVLNCYNSCTAQQYRGYQTLQTYPWGSQEVVRPIPVRVDSLKPTQCVGFSLCPTMRLLPEELAGKVLSEARLFYQLLCAPSTGKASPKDCSSILISNSLCCYWALQVDSELFRAALRKELS